MTKRLFEIKRLKKYFTSGGDFLQKRITVHAVDGVDFYIKENETLGVVGESGCGKTTLGRTILRLIEPTDGEILYKGTDLLLLSKGNMRKKRREMQMVFQDPFSSLNPSMTVGETLGRSLEVLDIAKGQEKREKVSDMLEKVGLDSGQIDRYPHEFSGGQRQRIAIARALIPRPKFVVLDEPTSSLDVSVRAQILELLIGLRQHFGVTYLFISHDLGTIRYISDRIAVMYLGKLVEIGPKKMFISPRHPYAQALFSAIPIPNPKMKNRLLVIPGDVPSMVDPPSGCRFHPRCAHAMKICSEKEPESKDISEEHSVACHLYQ